MKVSHRITRLATAALLTGALAAPAASARPVPPPIPTAADQSLSNPTPRPS